MFKARFGPSTFGFSCIFYGNGRIVPRGDQQIQPNQSASASCALLSLWGPHQAQAGADSIGTSSRSNFMLQICSKDFPRCFNYSGSTIPSMTSAWEHAHGAMICDYPSCFFPCGLAGWIRAWAAFDSVCLLRASFALSILKALSTSAQPTGHSPAAAGSTWQVKAVVLAAHLPSSRLSVSC